MKAAERVTMGDPGPAGRFGPFGGRFVPEALVPACEELEREFRAAWADQGFRAELDRLLREYAGRPTPVTGAPRLSAELGVRVLFKREDLAHTGSHKINNVVGQGLLARRLGKTALVAETGAGQHGVAAATVAARLGLGCTVYMGERDMARQELNVFRMELLGATVRPVRTGSRTLKDATSEALRHWVTTVDTTHYCIGSVLGPHPYPWLVREFQRVIGDEARAQCAAAAGLDATLMVTPATPPAQMRAIARRSRGFLYVMSVMATTGSTNERDDERRWALAAQVLAAGPEDAGEQAVGGKQEGRRPVLIGFGIDTPARAAAAARHADGVIVASALMRRVLDGASSADIARAVGDLRAAIDTARAPARP